jgi:hypothetical protein
MTMRYRDYACKFLGQQNCEGFERADKNASKKYLIALETEK